MKKPQQALEDILAHVGGMTSEMVDILASCGRVLAEDVTAQRDLPPWNNSAMDGYAFAAASLPDLVGRMVPISFTVAAGDAQQELAPGQVARIMTGAPLPKGADSVIMREETDEGTPGQVLLKRSVERGESVRAQGEDVPAGSVVLRAGRLLHPADVGLLAGVGRARVRVKRRPVVAILSTGDELAELGEPPHPARIINSNAWMLAAQVEEAGAIARVLPIALDSREDLAFRLKDAANADVLLSSGGVSVGDFDFVKEALQDAGCELDFWRVAIRPGKPLAVGKMGRTAVFGLPGNPVSSFVTFELFVRPALLAMQGHRAILRPKVHATVRGHYAKKPGMTHFLRTTLAREEGRVVAIPLDQQSSGALTSISEAHGLLVVADEAEGFTTGDAVTVLQLRQDWDV